MATAKIRERFQITIPAEIRRQLDCKEGDLFEVVYKNGKIIMIPQQTVSKAAVMRLTEPEQKVLISARQKIEHIQEDITNSSGLTESEIRVAIKVGLIDAEEAWWYTEDWQKGERKATKDIEQGRLSKPLQADELFDELDNL
ncbi:AbrB/MazE/SpoVT family DNA-binding domain-containing protein [bacterium]|nr:AbrB/MazE/SpoVT family DNA-binding domain-containing protein [bacterium]